MALLDAAELPTTWSSRGRRVYEQHERALDLLFFAAGYLFDIFAARAGVDHALLFVQQAAYLAIIGAILHLAFVRRARPETRLPSWLEPLWEYRSLPLHFCLGTLTNLYSIFFLMSASTLASAAFVGILFGAIALNEAKAVRESGVDVTVGLFVLCVFCFFSLTTPMIFGHVGVVPFVCSLLATLLVLGLFYGLLRLRLGRYDLNRRLLMPGAVVSACFLASYLAGIIPPVPIAAKKMGVYHLVQREGDAFVLYRDPGSRKAWLFGEPRFIARRGDGIYVFVAVYSPARFDDSVFMRWSYQDPVAGWTTSDRLALDITGGREDGFRAYTIKRNYTEGRWRVSVETTDGRVISRLGFIVMRGAEIPGRVLQRETY